MNHYRTIEVEPLTGVIGAQVHGVELREPITDEQRDEIRAAMLRHLVLFFREQDIDEDQQLAFASRFGPPVPATVLKDREGQPLFTNLEDTPESPPKADRWHTDVPFVPQPPDIAFLSMRITPPVGGDTLWSSLYAAYDALSPVLQELLVGLDLDLDLGASAETIRELYGQQYYDEVVVPFTTVQHPLVRLHPETQRRALYLCGSFMRGIVGMHADESAALLQLLQSKLDDPNVQVRWKWKQHDLVMWDERCTNHRAMSDHWPAHPHRLIRRCLAGEGTPLRSGPKLVTTGAP
jgi:taurine dioxygenase